MTRPPTASVTESYPSGSWRVYARSIAGARTDVTFVRGVKTKVSSLTTTDPGGPAAGSLVFPAVSYLDHVGAGDLDWLAPNTDIDVVWRTPELLSGSPGEDGNLFTVAETEAFVWEGYAGEFDFGDEDAHGGLTVPLIGALKQADNYLAKPGYLYQPLPYEEAITRALDGCTDRRFAACRGRTSDVAQAITAWAKGPGTGPATQVTLTVAAHGYEVKDQLRVIGCAPRAGHVNNGSYVVRTVLDANHFTITAPSASVGKDVHTQGYVIRDRPSMFPDWWTTVFNRADKVAYPDGKDWLLPNGVSNGQRWTGMLTRDTGKFEPVLANYVTGLLANMHTRRGQFTLLLAPGRIPYLTHREHLHAPNGSTLVVDALWPGVKISPRIDHTQQIGVVYAQGRATNGDAYTGMQVSANGETTWYDPAAYRRQVHPAAQNPWLDRTVMRKEVLLNFSDGLDEGEAIRASRDHLQRFLDPGVTATITLTTDPRTALAVDADGNVSGDLPFPRQAIAAGMSIQVKGLFGREAGVLFHITEATVGDESSVQLTVDSLYRDHLTVDQVRKRGRDALVPYRMLSTTAAYDPRIPDLLWPWSYKKGSGVIPFQGAPLFTIYGPAKVPAGSVAGAYDVPFPWTPYTKLYPPRKFPKFYIRVPPANHTVADENWANAYNRLNTSGRFTPYYVQLAAAGEIKLIQIAAYDLDGNVKAVPFHVSLYYQKVSYTSMPKIPMKGLYTITKNAVARVSAGDATITVTGLPKGHGFNVFDEVYLNTSKKIATIDGGPWNVATVTSTAITIERPSAVSASASSKCTVSAPTLFSSLEYPYGAGQYYPFFQEAWETILVDGTTPTFLQQTGLTSGVQCLYGVGTHFEKAGYWPGSSSDADRVTGMYVDETGFPFDFRTLPQGQGIDPRQTAAANQKGTDPTSRIRAYVMIYCDADVNASTYFLGRCFRKEFSG